MSLATEPQPGRVQGEIADRLAGYDRRHEELLGWLDRNGYGSTPQKQIPAEVLERARRELGHPAPSAPPALKTFTPAARPSPPEAPALAAPVRAAPAPATPAEERPMAEKTCSKCKKGLRADNTSGVCGDRNACAHRVAVADVRQVSSKPAAAPPAKVAVDKTTGPQKRTGHGLGPLDDWDVEDLLAARSHISAELEHRRELAAEQLDTLNEALGAHKAGPGKVA